MPVDMTKAAPKASRVLFENDDVRVIELNWKKGLKVEMHSHPKYFAYAITAIRYKSTSPDGKTVKRSIKKGEVAVVSGRISRRGKHRCRRSSNHSRAEVETITCVPNGAIELSR